MKEKYNEILERAKRYCRYQERCKSELEKKLNKLEVPDKMKELIIHELSEKEFFNNKRFSYEYAVGKFRNNNWGKIKIRYNLKLKSIEKNIIDEALKKIPIDEYLSAFNKIAQKLWIDRSKVDLISRKRGLTRTLQSKGWEFDLINKFLSETRKNKI
tara:strand:- start:523 stop:993 length:471 start_codon:yes stop_codon:yes gene_type:complete